MKIISCNSDLSSSFEKLLNRMVDLVISPSPDMREVLIKFGVDVPIEVVPKGVDLRPFLQGVQPLNRTDFGFSAQDVILI